MKLGTEKDLYKGFRNKVSTSESKGKPICWEWDFQNDSFWSHFENHEICWTRSSCIFLFKGPKEASKVQKGEVDM